MVCCRWVGLVLGWWGLGLTSSLRDLRCRDNDLLVYSVLFHTNWTRELFPKQYPEFRPPAQWSKVIGMSHNENYKLFQLGSVATPELKLFAETGKQEIIGNEDLKHQLILDQFIMPAIKNGSGEAMTQFFVDGNHSQVSMVSRIVPSPDWFVGIDSLDLCADGHWVDSVTIEASPIDAGTDSGFTFTAPNWSTEPQEPIYKITSQYPRHPANSFHYPHLRDLPAIAKFTILKHKTYVDTTQKDIEESKSLEITTISPSSPFYEEDNVILLEEMPELPKNTFYSRKHRKTQKKKRSKMQGFLLKKCQVADWSEWSLCNGPCGQSVRKRKIKKNGYDCPPLVEKRTCGCTKYVFDWKK